MGNCTRKIEIAEYVKMCGYKTDIDFSPYAGNLIPYTWEERDEDKERDYISIMEKLNYIDDYMAETEECKGYYNVFDELMEEHPEWFPKSDDIDSEWDIIDIDYLDSSTEKHRRKDKAKDIYDFDMDRY